MVTVEGPWTFADGTAFAPRSPQAAAIAHLFTTSLLVCGAVFALVSALVITCIVRFRDDGIRQPNPTDGHTLLEIVWTIVPVVVLGWLIVVTIRAMAASDPLLDRQPDVVVIGHQWWWEVRYPSGAVTANEIHIPAGRPLAFRIESADVIHDFWVPELGRKIDAIPGRPANIWLGADRPGAYTGACAEYCGTEHAWMRVLVVAESPEDFEAWQGHQLSPAAASLPDDAARGANTFASMTCVKCHSVATIEGAGPTASFGPDLTHVGSRVTIGAGVRPNTRSHMAEWLSDPQNVKPGCHMPNAQLTPAQVADLVAYFRALR